MPDEFISKGISLGVIIIENNSSECKGYRANLAKNNEKNDLDYTIGSININELEILSSYIYTDINEFRQNPYLKLIFAIHNLSNNNGIEDHNDETRLVISYNLYSNRKPLNDWDNPNFFPIVFPALFSYGDSSYIIPKSTKVFFYICAK